MKNHTQIIKRGAETWEITHVTEIWKGAHEYELIGRVIRDGELYYMEIPKWLAEGGVEWERQPRGYLIPKPAFKAVVEWVKVLS